MSKQGLPYWSLHAVVKLLRASKPHNIHRSNTARSQARRPPHASTWLESQQKHLEFSTRNSARLFCSKSRSRANARPTSTRMVKDIKMPANRVSPLDAPNLSPHLRTGGSIKSSKHKPKWATIRTGPINVGWIRRSGLASPRSWPRRNAANSKTHRNPYDFNPLRL